MFIDRNRIKSGEDLLASLELTDWKFSDLDVNSFVNSVWAAVSEIWENVDSKTYTNHDIRHSIKIIDYFMKLKALYEFSQYEILLFATSALIHDIGMQYNEWAPKKEKKSSDFYEYLGPEISSIKMPLSQNDIRRYHMDLGFKLIAYQIHTSEKRRPNIPEFCNLNSNGSTNALSRAAHIAFAHSTDKYLDKLKEHIWQSRNIEGGYYRPRLLAGLLRLCDELDGNYERIIHPNQIYKWQLDDYSQCHWLSCLFVENNELKIDNNVIHLNIKWRVPEKSDSELQLNIRNLLENMREAKVRAEIIKIENFFKDCREPEHIKVINLEKLSSAPFKFHFNIEESLKDLLKHAKEARYDSSIIGQSQTTKSNRIEAKVSDERSSRIETAKKPLPLEENLRNWFNNNKESGHFELINKNEHTDTYLNCRTLVSDQDLLRALADHIWQIHKDKEINYVLAVGTSAIPLAVNVAYRLDCKVTFTMSSATDYGRPSYESKEIIPNIEEKQNLLIIDDVISGGNVAKVVLDLISRLGKKLGEVYHQSIFRLGSRDYERDKRIKDYFSIVHIPNVMYAPSPELCPLCKAGETLRKEREMY